MGDQCPRRHPTAQCCLRGAPELIQGDSYSVICRTQVPGFSSEKSLAQGCTPGNAGSKLHLGQCHCEYIWSSQSSGSWHWDCCRVCCSLPGHHSWYVELQKCVHIHTLTDTSHSPSHLCAHHIAKQYTTVTVLHAQSASLTAYTQTLMSHTLTAHMPHYPWCTQHTHIYVHTHMLSHFTTSSGHQCYHIGYLADANTEHATESGCWMYRT